MMLARTAALLRAAALSVSLVTLAGCVYGGDAPARQIALAWRRGTGRREEFQLLGRTIMELAGKHSPTK